MYLGLLSNVTVVVVFGTIAVFAIPLVIYLGRKAYRTWWIVNDSLNGED